MNQATNENCFPEGWKIRIDDARKQAIVTHPNIGGYAAEDNPQNIAGTVLYWLAVALVRSGHRPEWDASTTRHAYWLIRRWMIQDNIEALEVPDKLREETRKFIASTKEPGRDATGDVSK